MVNLTPDASAVIEVERLVKSFGPVRAVDGVSFTVGSGEIFGLLGANGAGKTTLLGVIEGLQRFEQGRVTVLGWNVAQHPRRVKAALGVQLQALGLVPELTALEQMQLFARLAGGALGSAGACAWLERLDLDTQATRLPRQMSTGQQHRLAVLLAFVAKPPLICLDEPTAGLDPPARRAVAALIQKAHADGATVVLSTHDLGEAETLCHRVAVLDRGRLKALGTPMELVSQCQAPAQITTAASLPPALLRRLPGVIGVLHPGPYLRLETRTVADTVAALVDLARAQRVALDDLTVRQPSLEDAFFELTAPSELRE